MKQFKLFPTLLISIPAFFLISESYLFAAETFWDDFDGTKLNPAKWGYQDRNWPIGQTWFSRAPTVSGGIATFEHHTYNPYDPDQVRGQYLYPDILISETSSVIPAGPMALRMNFWASTSDWPLAWDSGMQPASNPADDIVCYYDVDYIGAMGIPAPASLVLVAIGLLSLRYIRRLRYEI
jgi:hypothetical protein